MASSTAPASHAEPFPGPPPTPTSLMDLPAPWLVQLATSNALDRERRTLLALFRTCTFYRDTVRRHRTAIATFNVPLTSEDFPTELERLCTVARRSSRVRLEFQGDVDENEDDDDRPAPGWMATEASITHLLVCAAAQLGGEQSLACIKEISLQYMEQTALVPAWVKVLCPNATKLEASFSTFRLDLPQPSMPHPHLQHFDCHWIHKGPPTKEHIRQQLSALPSLSSLALTDMDWAAERDEQQARRLMSSTVTRLELGSAGQSSTLQRLPTQLPCLRELNLSRSTVDDVGLEALLSMPHLERLSICGFNLTRSHTHRTWQLLQLSSSGLDVESFARLPLESIQACSGLRWVRPSTDAAAVGRVAAAVRRWGGLESDWGISGWEPAALLTTVGPLIAALPAAQQQRVRLRNLRDATCAQVQQLGHGLPAGVTHLHLDVDHFGLAADAWPALLPSLPASVAEVCLPCDVTEQQLVAMCQAAVRTVKVVVSGYRQGLSQQDLDRITRSLAHGPGGMRGQQQERQGSLVTLQRVRG